jgi:hypothetical protein
MPLRQAAHDVGATVCHYMVTAPSDDPACGPCKNAARFWNDPKLHLE